MSESKSDGNLGKQLDIEPIAQSHESTIRK